MSKQENENDISTDDIIKMAKETVSEKELDLLYIYLYGMIDKFSEAELAYIAAALEKIDPNFYDNEN